MITNKGETATESCARLERKRAAMATGLSDTELKVMAVIWREGGEASARQIDKALAAEAGFSSSATYTLIYRCIKKGAVERVDPGFVCRAIISQQEMQDEQTEQLVDRLFDGSVDKLFASLVDRGKVSTEEIGRLRDMISQHGKHFE